MTLDDAVRHLNPFFDEEIEVKDLLRLVLDGHLQLSINFVNHTYGVLGQAVGNDEIQESDCEEMELPFSGKQYVLMLHELYNDKWLREQNRKTLQSVTGVWDLTIAGHGLYEVEHLYYVLSNGTGVTKDTLGGVEVTQGNKTFVIYEPFHADKKKAEECQRERYEKNNEYLNKNNLPSEVFHFDYYDRRDWYPSSVIPDDAIWCIRTNELTRFIKSQTEPETMPTNEAPKGSHLAVIWGLKQMLLTGQDGNGNPIKQANVNQDTIRQALETFEDQHIARTGFGKRTIDDVFSEANRYIENRTK